MHKHPALVSTAEGIAEVALALRGSPVIAFDTEFIRETTFFPIVEIIQVATDKESWLVDAAAFKRRFRHGPKGGYDAGIEPLLDVFRDKSILKILHAAQGDQECLYTSFGMVASPVLDTAVAASLCGFGEAIGLAKLLKAVLNVELTKGHARTNWSVRPLPEQLLTYAHADVEFLVEAAHKLTAQLETLGRKEWAFEASAKFEDPQLYDPDSASMALKLARGGRLDKRGYAALIEIVRWREERVRQLNLPRRWVADDAVLIDLAHVRPKDMEHLSAFRGLNKGELKNSGEAILTAIRNAAESTEIALPRSPRPDMPSNEESQTLELLKCYVGILADRERIAMKHLLTTAKLLPLLRTKAEGPEGLVAEELLTPDAARLVGNEILAFLRGKRALSVDGTQIKIVEV